MSVTTDDILDAVRKVMDAPRDIASGPGATSTEIGEALGCSPHGARRYIKKLLADGVMVTGRVRRLSMAGIPCEVPGYRLKV